MSFYNPFTAEEKFWLRPLTFLGDTAEDTAPAILSSHICLARNIQPFPFPQAATVEQMLLIVDEITDTLAKIAPEQPFWSIPSAGLDEIDRQILRERKIIQQEFLHCGAGAHLIARPNACVSFQINCEDHLHILTHHAGLKLKEVYEEATQWEKQLSDNLPFAFDEKFGFLTAAPEKAGTALQASILLHLPGLVLSERLSPIVNGLKKLHYKIRGLYGDNNDNRGNMFLLTNTITMGIPEEETIIELEHLAKEINDYERDARLQLLEKQRALLLDKVGRAYGLVRYAHLLSVDEMLLALSKLRLGVDLKLFESIGVDTISNLFLWGLPAHLQKNGADSNNGFGLDFTRAQRFRMRMADLK